MSKKNIYSEINFWYENKFIKKINICYVKYCKKVHEIFIKLGKKGLYNY